MTDTNHGISLASLYWLPTRAFSINNLVEGKRERERDKCRVSEGERRKGGMLMVGEANGRTVVVIYRFPT